MTEETSLITITQFPEVIENLRQLRDRWERMAADAKALVCTEESVQSLKDARAQMRKEFDEADKLRKQAKAAYMEPWEKVETAFKECVSTPFKEADEAFRAEIGAYEGELKRACMEKIRQYYCELCIASDVDFLPLEKAMELGNIKVNLSDAKARTPKKLQDALSAVVNRVGCDMDRIHALDENIRNEVYVEFTKTYNLGASVAAVQERRREAEKAQREIAEREEAQAQMREAEAKVIAAAPPVEKPVEQVFPEFSFTVYGCTRSQLIKIREFLKGEGIKYE